MLGIFSFCIGTVSLWGVFVFALIFWFFYEFTSIERFHLLPRKNNVITYAIIENENHAFCLTLKYLMEKETEKRQKSLVFTNWISAYGTRTTRQIHSQLFILFFFLEKQQHLNRSLPWTHNLTLKILQKHHIWHIYFNVFINYAAIFGEKKLVSFNFRSMPWSYDPKKTMLENFVKENCKISACATVLKINPMKVKTVSLFYAYILWLNFEFDFLQNGY